MSPRAANWRNDVLPKPAGTSGRLAENLPLPATRSKRPDRRPREAARSWRRPIPVEKADPRSRKRPAMTTPPHLGAKTWVTLSTPRNRLFRAVAR